MIYGPGGVGKSELWSHLQAIGVKPLCLDVGASSKFIPTNRINAEELESFDDLRAALHSEPLWAGFGAVVIDDLTKAQEMAEQWVIKNVKHEKKEKPIRSIEDYGFGKGKGHIYDAMLLLLGDLDAQVRRGRHVICVAHECTSPVPNPGGDDWIRYEPRLQSPKSGENSVRHRVKEWCDHLLFIGYDTAVEDGKATGSGTRTIYPVEMPTHWAKSRTLSDPIVYQRGSAELWEKLFAKGE